MVGQRFGKRQMFHVPILKSANISQIELWYHPSISIWKDIPEQYIWMTVFERFQHYGAVCE
jgi:hypothetical protein